MKVRAIALGFDGNRRRRPGDVFEMPDENLKLDRKGNIVSRWLERADKPESKETVALKGSPASDPINQKNKDVI